MKRELIQYHLEKSGMHAEQADVLSRVFEEMATKADIAALEQKMETRIAEMKAAIGVLEARLTWRFVAAIVFLGAVMTVLDLFVD